MHLFPSPEKTNILFEQQTVIFPVNGFIIPQVKPPAPAPAQGEKIAGKNLRFFVDKL